jgi:hypothetical protein
MAPITRASAKWAVSRATALPEFWALVSEHSGLVGAWRLTGVCRASRVGAKDWLRTLRWLVVCGGWVTGEEGYTREVWRLDPGELRWERMSDLGGARAEHACCAVRGGVVVLGGVDSEEGALATVDVLRSSDSDAEELSFTALPPLSCGPRSDSIALPIDESESAEGQVLLLGGFGEDDERLDEASMVVKVDLATGACTPNPPLLHDRVCFSAARLPDGRFVCAGGDEEEDADGPFLASITAEVLAPPEQGSPDGAWRWRELPPHERPTFLRRRVRTERRPLRRLWRHGQ